MLRGTAAGLEFVFGTEPFKSTVDDIIARLTERPGFYRGARATIVFVDEPASEDEIRAFVAQIAEFDIEIVRLSGDKLGRVLAERLDLAYVGEPARTGASFKRPRTAVARGTEPAPSRANRALDADFAGARADLAARRARRSSSNGHQTHGTLFPAPEAGAHPPTLYHRGTLRSGQQLQFAGNVVVIGDVNPGAELVASGDIAVMGTLRGTAHAGAQGDAHARVIAIQLRPTQLRIATLIAADGGRRVVREAEEAFVAGDRIAIAPLGKGPR